MESIKLHEILKEKKKKLKVIKIANTILKLVKNNSLII